MGGDKRLDQILAVLSAPTEDRSDADIDAIVTYLKSLPPIHNQIGTAKRAQTSDDDW